MRKLSLSDLQICSLMVASLQRDLEQISSEITKVAVALHTSPLLSCIDRKQVPDFFDAYDVTDYRSRWSSIQTAFVEEPRKAVEDADNLVKSVLNKLSESFTQERQTLASQWERGDNVSTEDLRITFRRYCSFLDRLLNV